MDIINGPGITLEFSRKFNDDKSGFCDFQTFYTLRDS